MIFTVLNTTKIVVRAFYKSNATLKGAGQALETSGYCLALFPGRFVSKITLGRQLGLVILIIVLGEVSLRSDSTSL